MVRSLLIVEYTIEIKLHGTANFSAQKASCQCATEEIYKIAITGIIQVLGHSKNIDRV
jgi:hypothetical protein